MAHLTSCRISLLSRIVYNPKTILSRVSLPVQKLAHHMMYTVYVKMLREFQFDAKNYLTTIQVRHRSYMEPSELTKLETRMADIYARIYFVHDNL